VDPVHPAVGQFAPSDEAVKFRSCMEKGDDDTCSLAYDRPIGKYGELDSLLASVHPAPVVSVELRKGVLPFGLDVHFLVSNPMLVHELPGYFAPTAACGRE